MAQRGKSHHRSKNLDEDGHVLSITARTKSKRCLQFLLFLFLISCALLASSFSSSFSSYLLNARPDVAGVANTYHRTELINIHKVGPCSSPLPASAICCDRSDYHSDVCFMSGDVRTHSSSSSIFLRHPSVDRHDGSHAPDQEEKIKPYTRKWEAALAPMIPELRLRHDVNGSSPRCDVRHDAPALVFYAGGYTGNLFHAFNDGIVPLYITSHLLRRRVVLVVVKYQRWWHDKYSEILSQLSMYPLVDFSNDERTHCFPGAIVGVRFHGTFAVDPTRLQLKTTMSDFQHMLADAYTSRSGSNRRNQTHDNHPKLVIISRTGTRRIENEAEVMQIGKDVGFDVEVLRPADGMAMSRIYETLSSCDVMLGVHGAALTHLLFMRPGAAFVQIVPLGLDKYAESCYGGPAVELGLRYEEYKVLPRESSLYRKYGADDPVVTAPESVTAKGWKLIKEVYLEGQDVRLDGRRVQEMLARIFHHVVSIRNGHGFS